MSDRFILDGKLAVPCDNLLKWAAWFESSNRHVARDVTGNGDVSTIFLGINHQFGEGQPLLFETLVFGGTHDGYMERCTTWEEAEAQHARIVRMAKGESEGSGI